jgi:hypothetical protein
MKTAAILIAIVAVTGLFAQSRAQFDSCPISQEELNSRDFSGMADACQGDFSTEDGCDQCLVATFEPIVGKPIQKADRHGAEAHCRSAGTFPHWATNLF